MKKLAVLFMVLMLVGCGKVAKETETVTETEYVDRPVVVYPTPNAQYSNDGNKINFKYPTGNVQLKKIVYANVDNEEIVLFVQDSTLVTDIKVKTKDASKYFSIVDDDNTTYNVFCDTGIDSEHTIFLNRTNAQIEAVTGNYIEIYVNDILDKRYEMNEFELSN